MATINIKLLQERQLIQAPLNQTLFQLMNTVSELRSVPIQWMTVRIDGQIVDAFQYDSVLPQLGLVHLQQIEFDWPLDVVG